VVVVFGNILKLDGFSFDKEIFMVQALFLQRIVCFSITTKQKHQCIAIPDPIKISFFLSCSMIKEIKKADCKLYQVCSSCHYPSNMVKLVGVFWFWQAQTITCIQCTTT
jgi:hypothetical protein